MIKGNLKRDRISIIVPVFNEEKNIDRCYEELNALAAQLENEFEFEFIFTDNRSTDSTYVLLQKIAARDQRVSAFRLSKNFGYQRSIWTGYSLATGDAAIEFDCDLQDPPEYLHEFLKHWKVGAKIVYGIRKTRAEGWFISTARAIYYRLLNFSSTDDLPPDVGDFMLLDRTVIDKIKSTSDPNIYIRGLVFSLGFVRVGIPYDRRPRTAGVGKFSLLKLCKLSIDGFVSQSLLPLRLSLIFGTFIFIVTLMLTVFYLILWLLDNVNMPSGFTTLVILILISFGINIMAIGILGEYLARTYQIVQKLPMSIIEEEIDNRNERYHR